MAKYCPKCYAGIGPDDAVCGNCGNVLKENASGVEDFTAGVFDNENLSHDVSGKELPGEIPDEEILAHEIVADEIIADGIVEEEIIVSETITTTPEPAQSSSQYQTLPQRQAANNTEVPMTLGDWMLTMLLLYIPIVNIVMLIIWSVDSKTSTTKKHFAWATLIFTAIGIVLSILISILVSWYFVSMIPFMYY